jgi:iron(III) transport system substrate-binding protein
MLNAHGRLRCGFLLLWLISLTGCWSAPQQQVVVYTALDREFSEPILRDFEQQTGIQVLAKYDVESTKTVGLVNAIIQERNRPRCDLFWNNEILHTLRLERLDMLDRYESPRSEDFPPAYRSPEGAWHGFAARLRVLLVNTDLVPAENRPNSILDLVDPRWKGRVGIAKPLFGTTATHAAVLFDTWGDQQAREFFRQLRGNAQILAGNKQVALAVSSGQIAFGWTDTDDAIIERDKGMPVEIIYPDQGEGQLGALFIPNTLALIKGSAHGREARELLDFLLSAEVEVRLATGESAQFPLNRSVDVPSRAQGDQPIRHMEVDFVSAADRWESVAEFLREVFADQ